MVLSEKLTHFFGQYQQYPERKKKMQGLALSQKRGAAKTSFATPPYFV